MSKTPATTSEIEQAAAEVRDGLTTLWWGMYTGCLERGFTEAQAMSLLMTVIMRPYSEG